MTNPEFRESIPDFDLIRREIENQIKESEVKNDFEHAQLTWKWTMQLKSDADVSLQIAAIGHDYERSFPERERPESHESYEKYKQIHAKKSGQMIADLMRTHNFSKEEIEKTKNLVENHETGGKEDLQILADADSLAFFEKGLSTYRRIRTSKETCQKIIFMYRRLSENSKKILKSHSQFEDKETEKLYHEIIDNL